MRPDKISWFCTELAKTQSELFVFGGGEKVIRFFTAVGDQRSCEQ
jgi:hypothetical protein